MKTKHYILYIILLVTCSLQAQVSNYTFSQKVVDVGSSGNYTALSGVTLENYNTTYHNAGKYLYLNNVKDTSIILSGEGFPIGFDFNYDGQWMDRVGFSSNCYLKLGNSNDGDIFMNNDSIEGAVFTSGMDTLRSNIVCGAQVNSSYLIDSKLGMFYYNKKGFPGNRDFRVTINPGYGNTLALNTTIILREWKNEIEIYYTGISVKSLITTEKAYCGLRGKFYNNDSNNLNLREVTSGINTWSTSIKGDLFSSHCDYNTSLTPPKGLVYTFTPPAPDTLRTPAAFFKCYSWDSIPNTIYLGSNTASYVFANGAIEIPTNTSLSWSPEYTSSTNYYKLYLGTDSLDMDLFADSITATEYPLPRLAANTTYYYKIIAYNNAGMAKPCTGSFTTADKLTYCNPSWAGNGFIKTITFNTQIYTHPGVDDYRRELPFEAPYTTTLKRDSSYLFNITALTGVPCFGTRCWIDFNQDGVFDASTEQFNNASYITVPHNTVLGTTKMRVGKILCTGQASQFYPCSGEIQYQDFTITIAPNGGCTNFNVIAKKKMPVCFGESTGEIELTLSGGTAPYTISWKKGEDVLASTSQTLSGISRGSYQAFVTDSKDCSVQTELLALTQPLPLTVDTLTVNDSLIVSVSGGTGPYSCEWMGENNAIVSQNCFVPDSSGIYMLTITDANNCIHTADSIVIPNKIHTGIKTVKTGNTLKLSPNPSLGEVELSALTAIRKVEVFDLTGKLLQTKNKLNNKTITINISYLPAGLYLIKAYTDKGIETGRVIKQ